MAGWFWLVMLCPRDKRFSYNVEYRLKLDHVTGKALCHAGFKVEVRLYRLTISE